MLEAFLLLRKIVMLMLRGSCRYCRNNYVRRNSDELRIVYAGCAEQDSRIAKLLDQVDTGEHCEVQTSNALNEARRMVKE